MLIRHIYCGTTSSDEKKKKQTKNKKKSDSLVSLLFPTCCLCGIPIPGNECHLLRRLVPSSSDQVHQLLQKQSYNLSKQTREKTVCTATKCMDNRCQQNAKDTLTKGRKKSVVDMKIQSCKKEVRRRKRSSRNLSVG